MNLAYSCAEVHDEKNVLWRRQSMTNDAFDEWMKNLKERVVKKRKPKTRPTEVGPSAEMKAKMSPPSKPATHSTKFGGVVAMPNISHLVSML
jgi:hypothetical protein